MSKMFDSLRRAEEARLKKTAQPEHEAVAEPAPGTAAPQAFVNAGLLPEGFAREIGVLRNSLESALKGKDRRSVLFTSSVVSEGATTIAVNYAKLIAMHGSEKVLLCEMNARRPSFVNLFSIEPEPGVGSVFTGENSLSAVVSYIDAFNLSVAPIGAMDLAAMQQHFSARFPALLREAFGEFTTVVFDAPAVSVSPETAPMSSFVDGVVIVVQEGKTKREVIQRSIGAIQQQEGRVLGVILNRKKYYIPEFLYNRI
jgi:protein-tyrosine kinase